MENSPTTCQCEAPSTAVVGRFLGGACRTSTSSDSRLVLALQRSLGPLRKCLPDFCRLHPQLQNPSSTSTCHLPPPPSSIFHLLRTQIPRSFPLRAAEPATSAARTRDQPTCLGTTSRRPAHVAASSKVLSNNRIASTPQSLSLLSPRPDNTDRLTPLLIECSNAGHSCAPPSCLPGQSASGSGGGVFISAALPLPPSRWERLPRQCSPSIGRLWYVTHIYTHTCTCKSRRKHTRAPTSYLSSPSSPLCTCPAKTHS